MAGALHLCGVTTPNCAVSSRRSLHCQPLWSQRLDFTLSVAGGSRLCRSVKDSSRKCFESLLQRRIYRRT